MAIKKSLTQVMLHQMVLYHPTTGIFTKSDKKGNMYTTSVTFECTKIRLGMFNAAEEAHEAYAKVKRELHPFGEL